MRLYDQSMELESDKYEYTVEELEEMVKDQKELIRELKNKLKKAGVDYENQLTNFFPRTTI